MFIRQGLEFDGIFSGRVGDWYSKVSLQEEFSLQVLHYPYGALQSLFTVSVTIVELMMFRVFPFCRVMD